MSAAAPAPSRRPGTGRWRRRWHRVVIPFGLLVVLLGGTLLVRVAEVPGAGNEQALVPTGTGAHGSSRLAELLVERGVRIDPVRDWPEAEAALSAGGDAVLFVPKPTVEGAALVQFASHLPAGHRVVLVAPNRFELQFTGLPVAAGSNRWAVRARQPGCAVPEALAAGVAAVERRRYRVADPDRVCYGGGLVQLQTRTGAEVFVVGAGEPFTNSRIDEPGNAALALALLTTGDRVIWADALATDWELQPPTLERPRRDDLDRTGGNAFADLLYGYPPGVLAGLLLAVLLAGLVAVARARRLGPPVSEPLPVVVPAAEAVVGRGRLYERSRGRGVALAAVRAAAITRLARVLRLPTRPPPDPHTLVSAVAARAGLSAAAVHHTLYGPEPPTDAELARAVAAVDALVATVAAPPAGAPPAGSNDDPSTGHPPGREEPT